METFSALLAFCAGNSPFTDEFPAQGPVTRSFGVCFYLRLNKRLSNLENLDVLFALKFDRLIAQTGTKAFEMLLSGMIV